MANLSNSLQALLADVVSFYLRAHGYHWNVEGPDFSEYHGLFAEIYSDVYESIDPLAENIRKLDHYAPYKLSDFMAMRSLEDTTVSTDARDMAVDLLEANRAILFSLNKTFAACMTENQQGVANFIAERIDSHQKWAWQLRSSVKSELPVATENIDTHQKQAWHF